MGKAIILSDQDFSQKNLGRVTFSVTNEERAASIASSYCTQIGDQSVYDSIYNFVLGLLNSEQWDKIKAVYPMYGDNLAKLCTNLPTPGTFDLKVGGNATAETGDIDFVRTLGTGDVGTPSSPISGRYIFVAIGFICHNLGASSTTNTWFEFRNAEGGTTYYIRLQATSAQIGLNLGRNTTSYTFAFQTAGIMYKHNLVCFAIDRNTGNYVVLFNGVQTHSGTFPATSPNADTIINNILGQSYWNAKDTPSGEAINLNTNLADGEAFFYAIGEVEPANAAAVSQAIINGIITDKGITLGE